MRRANAHKQEGMHSSSEGPSWLESWGRGTRNLAKICLSLVVWGTCCEQGNNGPCLNLASIPAGSASQSTTLGGCWSDSPPALAATGSWGSASPGEPWAAISGQGGDVINLRFKLRRTRRDTVRGPSSCLRPKEMAGLCRSAPRSVNQAPCPPAPGVVARAELTLKISLWPYWGFGRTS